MRSTVWRRRRIRWPRLPPSTCCARAVPRPMPRSPRRHCSASSNRNRPASAAMRSRSIARAAATTSSPITAPARRRSRPAPSGIWGAASRRSRSPGRTRSPFPARSTSGPHCWSGTAARGSTRRCSPPSAPPKMGLWSVRAPRGTGRATAKSCATASTPRVISFLTAKPPRSVRLFGNLRLPTPCAPSRPGDATASTSGRLPRISSRPCARPAACTARKILSGTKRKSPRPSARSIEAIRCGSARRTLPASPC